MEASAKVFDNSPISCTEICSSQIKSTEISSKQIKKAYSEHGYFVIRDYFNGAEISALREVILKFHQLWKKDNFDFYQEEAFNSSLITGSQYLAPDDRVKLFNFISS